MMSDQSMQNDEMREIIEDFIVESSELVENVIQDVVEIEKSQDEEMINGIFRAVHTVKGTSSFLGFGVLSNLAHKAEDVLGKMRKKELVPNAYIADTLLEALDLMKLIIEDIRTKGVEDSDASEVIDKLTRIFNDEIEASPPDGGESPETVQISVPETADGHGEPKVRLGELLVKEEVISVDELDELLKKQSQGEKKKIGEIVVEEKLLTEGQLQGILTKQKVPVDEQTIRIDVKKLDELMNLVGELVLGKNRLILVNSIAKKGEDGSGVMDSLSDVTNYIEVITNDLQLSVMKARLVPVSKVFNKLPRLVRSLCAEFNKDIDLKIEGEDTELDKSLIEALHDPMVHIVRNSVDHGIESMEERAAKDKGSGILSIKAYNEGNHVVIEVLDDGKGINAQDIKNKVVEKGILSESEVASMSDKEALNLIFIPGLSTAKKVSSVSGRGVGMDVVKTNIEKMNGQVYIDSELGKWTKLTIKLPLTLAIMRALVVRLIDELYAIPLNSVIELVKLRESAVKYVDKNEVLLLRDTIIPIVDLTRIFSTYEPGSQEGYLAICRISDKTVAVKIHAVVGQEEVVIKPLGEYLGNIKGVSGATIRGDGRVVLILDIPSLLKTVSGQNIHGRPSLQASNPIFLKTP